MAASIVSQGIMHLISPEPTFQINKMDALEKIKIIIRIILIITVVLSFIPQIYKTFRRRTAAGLSSHSILVQFFSAGEQFFYLAAWFIELSIEPDPDDPGRRHGTPPSKSLSSCLDLVQVTVLLVMTTVQVALYLFQAGHGFRGKIIVAVLAFLFTNTIFWPLGWMLDPNYARLKRMAMVHPMLFIVLFHCCLNILVMVNIIAAYFLQRRETKRTPGGEAALSLATLASQAVVFLIMGGDWLARMWQPIMDSDRIDPLSWFVLITGPGSLVLNNMIFGSLQGGLTWPVWRSPKVASSPGLDEGREGDGEGAAEHADGGLEPERQPLLGSR